MGRRTIMICSLLSRSRQDLRLNGTNFFSVHFFICNGSPYKLPAITISIYKRSPSPNRSTPTPTPSPRPKSTFHERHTRTDQSAALSNHPSIPMTSVLTGRVDGTTADVVIDCQSTTITNDIIGDDPSNDLSANHDAASSNEISRDDVGRTNENHNANNIHTTYNASSTNDDDFQQQLLIRRWIRLQQLTIILILGVLVLVVIMTIHP